MTGRKVIGKPGLPDAERERLADAAMAEPEGQEALRGGLGRFYWRHTFDWGTPPKNPATREKLKRAHNSFLWDLMDLRREPDLNEIGKTGLRIGEAMLAREDELRRKFLKN